MSAFEDVQVPVREGDVLGGKFRVEKILGAGGMGVVVAAKHLELRQRVALKFLLPNALDSVEHTERFMREAQAAVRLKSEHVAKVLDIGRLDDGAPYIVMEFLEGSDLHKHLETHGPLPVEEAVSYVLQACEALAEAHSLGIIHRDMKPQNLFLTRTRDGRAQIKVLDFGISKTISATSQAPLSLTRTSTIIGSPLYMSPEQMRSAKNANERSDIWSLGVILYELLTGRVPFMAETMPDLCFKVAQDDVIAPTELRADIPRPLSDTIVRCLERDVEKRPANVAELAAEIEPFVSVALQGSTARISSVLHLASVPPRPSGPVEITPTTAKPVVVGAATGSSAWGKTQSLPVARRRRVAMVAAVAVTVVGAGAFIVLRTGAHGDARSVVPQASVPIAAAAPPPSPGAPSASTAASAALTPTDPTGAASSDSGSHPTKLAARAPAVAPLPAPPKPSATSKPAASGPPRAWE